MSEVIEYLSLKIEKVALTKGAVLIGYTSVPKMDNVIVLAFPYSEKEKFKNTIEITKKVLDVNKVSDLVIKEIKNILNSNGFICRDKGVLALYGDMRPLIEKAGLGVYGKNGLIVNPIYGSNLFYSMIFTNAPLPISKQHLEGYNPCKNCDICINICPAKAFNDTKFSTYKCLYHSLKGCKKCITYCNLKN